MPPQSLWDRAPPIHHAIDRNRFGVTFWDSFTKVAVRKIRVSLLLLPLSLARPNKVSSYCNICSCRYIYIYLIRRWKFPLPGMIIPEPRIESPWRYSSYISLVYAKYNLIRGIIHFLRYPFVARYVHSLETKLIIRLDPTFPRKFSR